ncbi:hypothetical protein [Blochmannia endosymbiont of Camponotus modoc]|uniref:hypothetical protein n=1 Tax=Blochmannia endosymbiont of Camponotus modoc TaxID=2945587 RepID=UPI002025890E|nr:hypothetical protein [Blochmannia endosymbiont of Camponotus modoc]URJ29598.1 hypothetical protein M9398_01405 [Blochmannia endosymbiont of Camponotus modoc]
MFCREKIGKNLSNSNIIKDIYVWSTLELIAYYNNNAKLLLFVDDRLFGARIIFFEYILLGFEIKINV